MALSLFPHVLGVVIWVGDMFFAYMALRPVAASVLKPPQRLTLWAGRIKAEANPRGHARITKGPHQQ